MKKFFQKVSDFVTKLFGGIRKLEKFLQDHVDDAMSFVNLLRSYSSNPYVLTVISLLPDKLQAKGGEFLMKYEKTLDKVIAELNIGNDCMSKPTFLERLQCFVAHYKLLTPAMQEAVSHKIVALYAMESSGRKVKQHIIDKVVQDRVVDLKNKITGG
jgi:hypothetical protein